MSDNIPNIDYLVSNREAFDSFVYTPVMEAVVELRRRWNDPTIPEPIFIPEQLRNGFKAIHSVCLISPNYQVRRYINIADALEMEPLIFERKDDIYIPQNNEWKYSLGKMHFFMGRSKNDNFIIEKKRIIDFNNDHGKKISTIKTLWGEPLTSFHHKLFFSSNPHLSPDNNIFDNSKWFFDVGGTTRDYYVALLSLIIKHGILFENFMLDKKELNFTREVFLPAFIKIYKSTGLKPLIVALEPTDIEGDEFWISYPKDVREDVVERLSGINS
jgi:hypothetical protein